ncbi:nitroreductase family protein [Paenarthrobacter nicotinovorans]|uniref:nitroreductase family protein n=1 Tax=Paenarthrobacter nicotinovorans TaxID=29320 RepID=UPI0038009535
MSKIFLETPPNIGSPTVLIPALRERWSPRSFDETAVISDAELEAILQAARWAPSASNSQPSRFIVGRRGTPTFAMISEALMGFNAAWANKASALVVAILQTETSDQVPHQWGEYDLGQAVAHLSVQAQAEGLHTHQMAGVEWAHIIQEFSLPENLKPITVVAVGYVAPPHLLPEKLALREIAPRTRLPLEDIVIAKD